MLVLSRKYGEKILVGDNIVITVVEIDRGRVRLGIQCPRNLAIWREEIRPIELNQEQDENPEETKE